MQYGETSVLGVGDDRLVSGIAAGDEIVVRMGNVIPFDGVVVSGEGMVNQSSLTGESAAVFKQAHGYVYAGTVLEEGELSVLMVDFSCALKLAMPISVLSAMREANEHRITVKGGKFLEALAEADTLVWKSISHIRWREPWWRQRSRKGWNTTKCTPGWSILWRTEFLPVSGKRK